MPKWDVDSQLADRAGQARATRDRDTGEAAHGDPHSGAPFHAELCPYFCARPASPVTVASHHTYIRVSQIRVY